MPHDTTLSTGGMSLGGRFRLASDPVKDTGNDVDYAEEGRKLLARVGLEQNDGFGATRYAPVSTMYKHPTGGGIL